MITETEIPADLKPLLFDGQLFYGKWGEIFFVSKNRLSYTDMASTPAVKAINDSIYGRYFLQDIQPAWQRDSILRDLYRYAKPWATDLSGLDSQQLIAELLHLFQQDELRVWQLTDGWVRPPEPFGKGGLPPLAGSNDAAKASNNSNSSGAAASAANSNNTASKARGGATATNQSAPAKTATHEVNSDAAQTPAATDVSSATEYVALVSAFTGQSSADIADFYADMAANNIDYQSLIENAISKHGLTLDEAHAVFGYTTKLFYRDLNHNLLSGGSPQANALSALVCSGIAKMPDSDPTQYRGWRLESEAQRDKFDNDFAIGNSVTSNFWSTASSEDDAYKAERNVVIHTDCAKDISDLAFGVHFHDKVGKKSYSSETIIPPGTKFTVAAIDGEGRHVLEQDI